MAMNGIDIASYQKGIDLSKVPCDFVIVKATEGTGYVNPDCARAVEQALKLGKAVGVYHYVNGTGATAEADFFYSRCRGWNGRVVWCVDWEAGGNRAWGNTTYLDSLIKRLRALTGRPPMLYASSSAFPWSIARANDCGTWVAQYASMAATGYQGAPWNESAYSCTIRQYSSAGRLAGWSGNLDLNKFYGDRAAWDRYAGATSKTTTTTPTDLEVIINMEATHVIFTYQGTAYIADILAGTYRAMKDEKTFADAKTVLSRTGAKVRHWSEFVVSRSNEVDNPAAFGVRVG